MNKKKPSYNVIIQASAVLNRGKTSMEKLLSEKKKNVNKRTEKRQS